MHIGGMNRNYWYHMDQKELEVVEEEKDLGMLITNDLKASQQCTAACNRANRVLGMMNRTIVYKSKDVLLNLYKSCRILYTNQFSSTCRCTVWLRCYQKDKSLIERVQHRFTRMIPGFSKLLYRERLKRLGLWSLEERRNRADLIQVLYIVNIITNGIYV